MNSSPTWMPTASLQHLALRGRLLWELRRFFHDREMLEVHTPVLSRDTVIDRYIEPIVVTGESVQLPTADRQAYFLQTSPEFGMKRLMAAGMDAIYQIAPVFRAGERGRLHNPEFTMVEWYRRDEGYDQSIYFLGEMVREVMKAERVETVTYQTAFQRAIQCDPLDCRLAELTDVALQLGLHVDRQWSSDPDDWLNLLFSEAVQPTLGMTWPEIVTHFPASQSALARVSDQDPRTAERYELFIHGIELANGYHELLDAEELERRNRRVSQQRSRDGQATLPSESGLLSAMRAGLPACSGCALGFDRLVLVAAGATSIDQVIAFPIERA